MREIKFRAWDKEWKIMVTYQNSCTKIFIDLEGDINYEEEGLGLAESHQLNSERLVLMQFTGLKDKNNKEIYEGDILSGVPYNQEVYYDKVKCAFEVKEYLIEFTRKMCLSQKDIDYNKRRVIGNIYKNPEILKR